MFLVFVLVSTFIWLVIKLSNNFTSTVTYQVDYQNIPVGQILVKASDSTITVGLDASGFDLVGYHLFRKKSRVSIDLSGVNIRSENNLNKGFLLTAGLTRKLARQIGSHNELLFITPDSLKFIFLPEHRRRVPVQALVQYRLRPQHMLYDPVRVVPDSIWIYGPGEIVDTIRAVRTLSRNFPDLSESLQISLPLQKPAGLPLTYSADMVEVILNVEKFTEKTFSLPINIVCNNSAYSLRIFPETVKVHCLVALKDYKRVDPAMFEASIYCDPEELPATSKLRVMLTQFPSYVKISRIEPERVEYILVRSTP